jgi:hypothetical protein
MNLRCAIIIIFFIIYMNVSFLGLSSTFFFGFANKLIKIMDIIWREDYKSMSAINCKIICLYFFSQLFLTYPMRPQKLSFTINKNLHKNFMSKLMKKQKLCLLPYIYIIKKYLQINFIRYSYEIRTELCQS